MSARLREIAEDGAFAYRHMIEIGEGVGALPDDERVAIRRYDETFGLDEDGAPLVLALLDVAGFVDDFLFGCEDPDGNLTDANLAELRDRAMAHADRLREVAP